MKENQKDPCTAKSYRTYTMEKLRGMTIKQMLYLNGLGTLKKHSPKAIQIVGAIPSDKEKL